MRVLLLLFLIVKKLKQQQNITHISVMCLVITCNVVSTQLIKTEIRKKKKKQKTQNKTSKQETTELKDYNPPFCFILSLYLLLSATT